MDKVCLFHCGAIPWTLDCARRHARRSILPVRIDGDQEDRPIVCVLLCRKKYKYKAGVRLFEDAPPPVTESTASTSTASQSR